MKPVTICFLFLLQLINLPATQASDVSRDWTVLLYLNGKNNLDDFGKLNLNQIETIGSTEKINIVTQWGSLRNKDTVRMLMQRDSNFRDVTSPVLQNLGNVDMGSKDTLADFLNWGQKNFPARHYFVIVWNHGSGWHDLKHLNSGGISMTDISWDDTTGNSIKTEELGNVLGAFSRKIGKKIDVYGSDACLMGMIEVAGELADSVNYFIGSQDLEPGDGWPYDRILDKANSLNSMMPLDFTNLVVNEYAGYYAEVNTDITLSTLDLNKYNAFVSKIKNFSRELSFTNKTDGSDVLDIVKKTQSFDTYDYIDFGDLALNISNSPALNEKLKIAADTALKSISSIVVQNRSSGNFTKAQGVSIWFPTYKLDLEKYGPRYSKLKFNLESSWLESIKSTLPK